MNVTDNKLEELKQRIIDQVADAAEAAKARVEGLQRGYEMMDAETTLQPGYYDIIETDYGGYHDYVQFTVQVTEPMTEQQLLLKLFEDFNYLSPWNYVKYEVHKPDARQFK